MKPGKIQTALYATVLTATSIFSSGCGRVDNALSSVDNKLSIGVDRVLTEPTSATYEGKYFYQVEEISAETGEKINTFVETNENLTTWMPGFSPLGVDVLYIDSTTNKGRKNEFKKRFVDIEYHTDPGLDAVVTWKGPKKIKTLISPETLSAPRWGPLSHYMTYRDGQRVITDKKHPFALPWLKLEAEYNSRLTCSVSESIGELFREQ